MATFTSAFREGQLAHAWLITGPKGVGKATLAYHMARLALSQGNSQSALFDQHPAPIDDTVARQVAANSHPDLLSLEREADPKTNRLRRDIVVGSVRRLNGFLRLKPAAGIWRVVIIDSADEMNRNAANAVLKLVEEPPNTSLILLVSHQPGRLLPTLRSRCRTLPLRPLSDDFVTEVMSRCIDSDMAVGDRKTLTHLASGSPGRAVALATLDGVDVYREIAGLLATAPAYDTQILHGFADRVSRRGAEQRFELAMELLAGWIAGAIKCVARDDCSAELVPGEADARRRMVSAGALDQWVELWENTRGLAERAGHLNLDRKQVVLTAFHGIARLAT